MKANGGISDTSKEEPVKELTQCPLIRKKNQSINLVKTNFGEYWRFNNECYIENIS